MGLSYLSKKSWHPSTFKNIEDVWQVEQALAKKDQKKIEHIKKLKEERQIDELKRMQVEAGIISKSSLEKIDWMYNDRTAQNNANTAEEYLMGKEVKDVASLGGQKSKEKPAIIPCIRSTYATPENEAFVKTMEDPLLYIKQKELE